VHIALVDKAVINVTAVAIKMISVATPVPALPTTQGSRKNIITPKMLRIHLIFSE
jgi:hypothetical protein